MYNKKVCIEKLISAIKKLTSCAASRTPIGFLCKYTAGTPLMIK